MLDRRLLDTFDRYTVTGLSPCPECMKRNEDGYIAMIGVDLSKSGDPGQGDTVRAQDMHRTGEIIHLSETGWMQLFGDVPIPKTPEGFKMTFAPQNLVLQIIHMAHPHEDSNNG